MRRLGPARYGQALYHYPQRAWRGSGGILPDPPVHVDFRDQGVIALHGDRVQAQGRGGYPAQQV